jgi:hypothetical protein
LQQLKASPHISCLFPDWQQGDERLVILSPHDDDGLLGAGYVVLAALANGAVVYLCILCDGSAGYSTPNEKESIVATRRAETLAAYGVLGLDEKQILRCDYPDFSLIGYEGWSLPNGSGGSMQRILPLLRHLRATRLLIPNGKREHIDHEATERIGRYDGPQVGDRVLADFGLADPIRSTLQYAVWGDLSPEDALVNGRSPALRGNRAILAPVTFEERVGAALRAYRSQARIIESLLTARRGRRHRDRWLEVYLALDPRPHLDFGPYHNAIEQIDASHLEQGAGP